jgi:hypothetical protein
MWRGRSQSPGVAARHNDACISACSDAGCMRTGDNAQDAGTSNIHQERQSRCIGAARMRCHSQALGHHAVKDKHLCNSTLCGGGLGRIYIIWRTAQPTNVNLENSQCMLIWSQRHRSNTRFHLIACRRPHCIPAILGYLAGWPCRTSPDSHHVPPDWQLLLCIPCASPLGLHHSFQSHHSD